MKAKELDKKFAAGDDISEHLDIANAHRPQQDHKRVTVDFPLCLKSENRKKR